MTNLNVEKCEGIIPRVLRIKVLHSDFVHVIVFGLTKLGASIGCAQTPAETIDRRLPDNLTILDGHIIGAESKHPPRLPGPSHSLEHDLPRVPEKVGAGGRASAAFGLDPDQVAGVVVGGEVGGLEPERPDPVVVAVHPVGPGPGELDVVLHHHLGAGDVGEPPEVGPRGVSLVSVVNLCRCRKP